MYILPSMLLIFSVGLRLNRIYNGHTLGKLLLVYYKEDDRAVEGMKKPKCCKRACSTSVLHSFKYECNIGISAFRRFQITEMAFKNL